MLCILSIFLLHVDNFAVNVGVDRMIVIKYLLRNISVGVIVVNKNMVFLICQVSSKNRESYVNVMFGMF